MTSPGSGWRRRAACRDVDPELFFPIGNTGFALKQIAAAKQVCGGCHVISACKEWALAVGVVGVWGGTTDTERDAIKRRRQRSRAAAGSST
ncbi:WhiB family transcriptional regulator [Nonomuraea wenchangensis]